MQTLLPHIEAFSKCLPVHQLPCLLGIYHRLVQRLFNEGSLWEVEIFTRIMYRPVWNTETGQEWLTCLPLLQGKLSAEIWGAANWRCRVDSTVQSMKDSTEPSVMSSAQSVRNRSGCEPACPRTSQRYSGFNRIFHSEERKIHQKIPEFKFWLITLLRKKFISQIRHGTFSKNTVVLKYLLRYVSLLRIE